MFSDIPVSSNVCQQLGGLASSFLTAHRWRSIPCTPALAADSRPGSPHSSGPLWGYGTGSSLWCCRGKTARWHRQTAGAPHLAVAAMRPSGTTTQAPGYHSGSSTGGTWIGTVRKTGRTPTGVIGMGRLTSTQVVGISAGLLLILNLYQPGSSEWSQIRSWMAVFWISVESKSTVR